jgi:peroxiredoxin/predicted 2-oxoglutarate/Fe(II)-dependent dioxygenase YbiX
MAKFRLMAPGDPAPWFTVRTSSNPRYVFDTTAGRYIVLCFFGSSGLAPAQKALQEVRKHQDFFNDERACFFGISNDLQDEAQRRVNDVIPGYRFMWDFDGAVAKLYGAMQDDEPEVSGKPAVRPCWIVLDPTLRVMNVWPFKPDSSEVPEVFAYLRALPDPQRFAGVELQAPIVMLPNVFERDFCQKLIGLYETNGGQESGFVRQQDGKTVMVHDHGHKRRKDYEIVDDTIIKATQARILRRVAPEIQKIHQFAVTRMERYIVCCYAAEDGAHFARHRDNTTAGTAHRRFAVSINLNDDFDGGEVSFPEYGPRGFKAPAGGAVIFSCSMLHAVSKVTRGRRFAFLPFLYDEAAAKIREDNNKYLDESITNQKKKVATPA